MRLIVAGLALLSLSIPAGADGPKKPRNTYTAQRAGWMMGMYIGEGVGQPYPFVSQVDPESEARIKGIRVGDELMRFQDREVRDLRTVFDEANRLKPGRHVTLWVRRGPQNIKVELRVPRDPGAPPQEKVQKAKDASRERGAAAEKRKKKRPPIVVKPIPSEQ